MESISPKFTTNISMDNDLAQIVANARTVFNTGLTQSLKFREKQLQNLRRMFIERESEILHALNQDLRKPAFERIMADITTVLVDIESMLRHLKKYAADEKLPWNLLTPTDRSYIRKEPFGVVLIFGTWNYPFMTTCQPLAGAIAAGNCVIVKVSEMAPASAKTMGELLPKYLDKRCYQVVQGDVEVSKSLMKNKFDYIFFTGSHQVGRRILQAAATHLTPVTLELGGRNPCYIDASADFKRASKKILWGKSLNGGQLCVGSGYVLCSEKVKDAFVYEAKTLLKEWYGHDAQASPDVVRIVNRFHFNRLKKLLETTRGTIAIGGRTDEADLWIEPTVVVNVDPETDVLMQEEIFGPILPIITVSSIHDAIRIIQSKPKPLSLYIFSKDKKATRKVLESTSSGNICINDVYLQSNRPGLPFGGVGESGMGSYHGKATFDTFSHRRTVLEIGQDFVAECFYGFRYAPYTNFKILLFSQSTRYFEMFYVPFWGTISHTLVVLIALALAFSGFLLYPLWR